MGCVITFVIGACFGALIMALMSAANNEKY